MTHSAAAADERNWDPETAEIVYGVTTTESGEHAYRIEYDAAHPRS